MAVFLTIMNAILGGITPESTPRARPLRWRSPASRGAWTCCLAAPS